MDYFSQAFAAVVGIEAGYVDPDPAQDPGGETKFGISKRAYPNLDIKSLTADDARSLYAVDYWRDCSCDKLPWPLCLLVFDCAVNQGQPVARKLLQQALGVTADGVLGPVTLAAATKADAEALAVFMASRALRYMQAPNFEPNKRGWFKRLFLVTMEGGSYGMV